MTQILDLFPCGDISQEEENQTGGKEPKEGNQQGGQRQRDADRALDHLRSWSSKHCSSHADRADHLRVEFEDKCCGGKDTNQEENRLRPLDALACLVIQARPDRHRRDRAWATKRLRKKIQVVLQGAPLTQNSLTRLQSSELAERWTPTRDSAD